MAKTNNEEYRKKLMPIDEAVRMVKPVDRVFVGFASATAFALMDALWDRRAELEHVQILCSNGQRDCRMYSEDPGELGDPFEFNTAFMGYSERIARKHGRKVTFTSCPLSEVDVWMRDIAKPRVAFLLVSPPDEDGNMSFGASGTCNGIYAAEMADVIVLQVNSNVPYVRGEDCMISPDKADAIVEADEDLGEVAEADFDDTIRNISKLVLEEIPDGATIQLGIGKMATAVSYGLRERNDLGIHSEMFSESMMKLMRSGNITNKKKGFMDGKSVFSFAIGSNEMYRFMDHNDDIYAMPFPVVNDIDVIASNKRMISINSAIAIDLYGQVGAEMIGRTQYSAVGGQTDFVIGAQRSEGGKSIIAIESSYMKNGERHSKIVFDLAPGCAVTTPRSYVQYVATEYGCINLKKLTMEDRVRAMISLAHPDFRDQLTEQAKEYGLIRR